MENMSERGKLLALAILTAGAVILMGSFVGCNVIQAKYQTQQYKACVESHTASGCAYLKGYTVNYGQ